MHESLDHDADARHVLWHHCSTMPYPWVQENLDRIKACYDAAKDPSKPTITKHHEQAEAENDEADHDHELHAPASDEGLTLQLACL